MPTIIGTYTREEPLDLDLFLRAMASRDPDLPERVAKSALAYLDEIAEDLRSDGDAFGKTAIIAGPSHVDHKEKVIVLQIFLMSPHLAGIPSATVLREVGCVWMRAAVATYERDEDDPDEIEAWVAEHLQRESQAVQSYLSSTITDAGGVFRFSGTRIDKPQKGVSYQLPHN